MSSPTPSYIPYTPKRHSTQTSIASLSQVQSSTSSSSSQSQPPSTSSSRAPSHSRTTSSARSDYSPWLKSPQPNRPSLIGVNHQWQSSSSTTSSSTTTTQNGRSPLNAPTTQSYHQSQLGTDNNKVSISASSPIPHNTLPFSPSPRPPQSQPSPSPVNGNSSTTIPHSSTPTKRSRTVVVPYLESFQPVGVRRDRTEQFFENRRNKRREKLGEEERLERRMDKLLELHFPTSTATTSASSNPTPTSSTFSAFNSLPSLTKSAKDFWKQSTTTTTTTTVTTSGGGRNYDKKSSEIVVVDSPSSKIKEEEQKLVKWQEDKSIKNCQICKIGFGFLTRKHHCRLCGRIICFLPPTPPPTITTSLPPAEVSSTPKEGETKPGLVPISRRERCSTFFTFISNQNPDSDDHHHQQLERRREDSNHRGNIRFDDDEAEEEAAEGSEYKEKINTNTTGGGGGTNFKRRNGLIVEISPPIEEDLTNAKATFDEMMMKATSASTAAAAGSGGQQNQKKVSKEKENVNKKDERKKVRICRDCLNIVLRHQLANLPLETPNWLKLYRVLKTLETEIEQSLIEFQQLANQLQKSHSKEVEQSSTAIRPPSISQTSALRARLLTNLASYDTLSKRLLSLSTSTSSISTGGSSNELDRLQKALGTRSMNWLSEKLSLLRTLGTVEELSGRNASKKAASSSSSEQEGVGGGGGVKSLESLLNQDELRRVRERIGDVGAAGGEEGTNGKLLRLGKNREEEKEDGQLGVLLEQEKLVQSYLEDANSRRQFEDAASLQASLDELRGEIQKCDTLLVAFSSLTYLYLEGCIVSQDIGLVLLKLPQLEALGFGEGIPLSDDRLERLVIGPARLPMLKRLILQLLPPPNRWKGLDPFDDTELTFEGLDKAVKNIREAGMRVDGTDLEALERMRKDENDWLELYRELRGLTIEDGEEDSD
ncbi:hypothetical protein JCM3765_001585 [Sporobolomyces pararoseus]